MPVIVDCLQKKSNRQDTGAVKPLVRRIIATAAAFGVFAGASCFVPKHQSGSCKERGAVFDRRVELIKQDADVEEESD